MQQKSCAEVKNAIAEFRNAMKPTVTESRTSVCLHVCVCVCLLPVPSRPRDAVYISSTENSMTLSWTQSGTVDNYAVASNNTVTSSANFSGVGEGNVSVTVSSLPTSGAYYCITVTAVSGHLDSDSVTQCNYTGEQFVVVLLQFFFDAGSLQQEGDDVAIAWLADRGT